MFPLAFRIIFFTVFFTTISAAATYTTIRLWQSQVIKGFWTFWLWLGLDVFFPRVTCGFVLGAP
jgi:hypothetical protein